MAYWKSREALLYMKEVKTPFGYISLLTDRRCKPYKEGMRYHVKFHDLDEYKLVCDLLRKELGLEATWIWKPGSWQKGKWSGWYQKTKWARSPSSNIYLSHWDHVKHCTLHHWLAEEFEDTMPA